MNATPEKSKKSRKEAFMELSEDHSSLALPDIWDYKHIVEYWHEVGTFLSGMSGIIPLTWEEINNWKNTLSLDISNWELLLIKRLSAEYCAEFNQASDRQREAPYSVAVEEIDYVAQSNSFKSILRSFRRKKDDSEDRYEVE